MREAIAGRLVGTKVARVEDPRLLTGAGRYVDDVTVPGMLHADFVRSPVAHAVIRGIDVGAARRLPGVVAVYTGADLEALTHPFMGLLPLPDLYHPVYFALAVDRVRCRRRPGCADRRRDALRRGGRRGSLWWSTTTSWRRSRPSSTHSIPRARRSGPRPAAT